MDTLAEAEQLGGDDLALTGNGHASTRDALPSTTRRPEQLRGLNEYVQAKTEVVPIDTATVKRAQSVARDRWPGLGLAPKLYLAVFLLEGLDHLREQWEERHQTPGHLVRDYVANRKGRPVTQAEVLPGIKGLLDDLANTCAPGQSVNTLFATAALIVALDKCEKKPPKVDPAIAALIDLWEKGPKGKATRS